MATGLLALGSALPASASAAAGATCNTSVHTGLYTNPYGYATNKAYFTANSCGKYLQAVIACDNNSTSALIDGAEVTSTGPSHASYASCNKNYPFEFGYSWKYN